MFAQNDNPQVYKEHVISFIDFDFGESVTIMQWLENMNLYGYDIQESYKETIIGHTGNLGTTYLLFQIVQCWCACAADEEKLALTLVLYCSRMMYKYDYCIEFPLIKRNG